MQDGRLKVWRRRLLVEPEVQWAILVRFLIYVFGCGSYFAIMLVVTRLLQSPQEPLPQALGRGLLDLGYWLPGLLVLAPLMLHDLLKTTGRFAGPVVRLRQEIDRTVAGRSERPLQLRPDDHLQGLATSFNRMRGELLVLRKELAEYQQAHREPEPASA